jgi:hypothetical protein
MFIIPIFIIMIKIFMSKIHCLPFIRKGIMEFATLIHPLLMELLPFVDVYYQIIMVLSNLAYKKTVKLPLLFLVFITNSHADHFGNILY